MIISAPRIFIDGSFTGPASITVENGIITSVSSTLAANADIILDHGYLTPGLIDIHNNGAFGVDCATASPTEWEAYIAGLTAHGVTSVLPAIITAPIPAIHASAARIAAAMAAHPAILGLHLEGPFLAPTKHGAHREDWLQLPTQAALDELLSNESLRKALRLFTLAPELSGAIAAILRLAAADIIISLGHSEATAAETQCAADAGATLVTHVFNAQPPLHHRAPGIAGAALTDPRLHPCLIVDSIHVDPVLLNLAFAACPRAIAVTDSIVIAGQPEGTVKNFGGMPVHMEQNIGRRPDDTIAGAGITLDEGIRRMIAAGITPEISVAATTCRPADALHLTDRGRIAVGLRADLVWWNDDFTVRQVWTAGATKPPPPQRRGTEHARADLDDLDERDMLSIINIFLAQERAAQNALSLNARHLAAMADEVAAKLAGGGRLFYAGAGTSGRLALLDAIECGPTFGVPDGLLLHILAGGDGAFLKAIEGAEDDSEAAIGALQRHKISAADALIGIAASGTTPFTLAAINHAKQIGAFTGAIVNNVNTPIAAAADIAVVINSGPEIIAGSTRLSAGTTQKIALNILSSTVMIRLGKTHGPFMVDLRATNEKLRKRATRITVELAGGTDDTARQALNATGWHVKTAILCLRQNLSAAAAREKLSQAQGSLRKALMTTP